jgi:ATP-dependent RNA helicase DeaD
LKITSFNELPISAEVLHAIQDMGFEEATPIQAESIPYILEGRDILGQAQTGTGKTCAFGIPIIERVELDNNHVQYLILAPTRELAIQIADEMHEVTKYKEGVRILSVYGGQPIDRQILALKKRPQIIVGTPGRVMDHMRRKTIRLENMRGIILDEADEMLNMGFKEDIDLILESTPAKIQKVFFSATMPKSILELTDKYLNEPIHVRIAPKQLAVTNIAQHYIEVRESNKLEVLCRLIEAEQIKLALIFCNTKRRVDDVYEKLQTRGYSAEALHGDMKQMARTRVMNRFKSGDVELLVATDVAARGIDVDDIEVVINYDLPQDEEYYVHRIGRTGRAGRAGKAYTFVVGREIIELKNIQHYSQSNIIAAKPPTLMDVTESRVASILTQVKEALEKQELTSYIEYIEKFVEGLNVTSPENTYYTTADVAAALLRQAMGETFHQTQDIEPVVPYSEMLKRGRPSDGGSGFSSGSSSRGGKKVEAGMTRLFMNVGADDKIQPRHIVEAVCSRSNLTGRQIGAIAIYGRYTFVDVPTEAADEVAVNLTNQKVGSRVVRVEKSGEPGRAPERSKSDRPWQDKPKSDRYAAAKPYSDSPRSDKPWQDKPKGDRPFKAGKYDKPGNFRKADKADKQDRPPKAKRSED